MYVTFYDSNGNQQTRKVVNIERQKNLIYCSFDTYIQYLDNYSVETINEAQCCIHIQDAPNMYIARILKEKVKKYKESLNRTSSIG